MPNTNRKTKKSIKTIFKRVANSFNVKPNTKIPKAKKEIKKKKFDDVKRDKIKKILIKKSSKVLSKKKKSTKKPTRKVLRKKIVSKRKKGMLRRARSNPVISPRPYGWESEATLNPAAIYVDGKVHLFYRALGADGISRIGYASSTDGINFKTRLSYPIYIAQNIEEEKHFPYTSPARKEYNPAIYTSGGGWGGCEDPRAVIIDGYVYMTFNMFNGWNDMRVAVVSIKEENLTKNKWMWENFAYLSKPGDRQKNWVLFPEKINGKFALFYNLDKGDPNRVHIAYLDKLNNKETPDSKDALDPQRIPDHEVAWHYRTRSAACPPLRTKDGWLLLYHAMDKSEPNKYKVGAMLLDLNDPEKVLYRSKEPILEPDEWYENDYKPGIVYANGAIIKGEKLFVYYGGGDKYVCVATIKLADLINSMKEDKIIKLKKIKKSKEL